ncbi:fatty acid binding protein 7, brain, b [Hoplias malabaricus]|uniref:fatty acid binding protein 7, brain, b n=1 Tax=Hoplias malabaricus TaxID=27720 RepID=UPI00346193FD
MDALCGSWKMVKSENVDDYLKALGHDDELRQIGNIVKPMITISQDGDTVVVKTETSVKSSESSFILGQELDHTTIDNRNCKSVVYVDEGQLVHVQKWDGNVTTITREVKDGQMIVTLTFEDAVAVCAYDRV